VSGSTKPIRCSDAHRTTGALESWAATGTSNSPDERPTHTSCLETTSRPELGQLVKSDDDQWIVNDVHYRRWLAPAAVATSLEAHSW